MAAYLPNIAEALAAFFATASIGAIWSSCSPDFGVQSVVDRFAQIEPVVFLAVDGYRYGGKDHDRRAEVAEIASQMPSLRATVTLGYLGLEGDWDAHFPPTDAPLEFARLPFDHPLYVLYSSGTTGLPKAIVHGHGGILLEHLEWLGIQIDAKAGDRLFWFTTTGWMMWNALVSGLLTPASIVLYDGNPGSPDMGVLWDLAEASGITTMGVGAAYIHACMKAGVEPRDGRELANLRAVGSTGSPLSPEGFGWIYEQLGDRTWLFSTSGGTDVCSAFVGGIPTEPVRRGEIQVRHLGAAVEAFDEQGRSVVDDRRRAGADRAAAVVSGRLLERPRRRPLPRDLLLACSPASGGTATGSASRPAARASSTAAATRPSTAAACGWARPSCTAQRSPSRRVVDALAVDIPDRDGTGNSWLPLFVVLADGAELTPETTAEIRRQIRTACSPRHVPDEIIARRRRAAHAVRQGARGADQEDPDGRRPGQRPPAASRSRTPRRTTGSSPSRGSAPRGRRRASPARSNSAAWPWPTPMQSVARPSRPSRRRSSCSSETTSRAPLIPSGWPIAIAPPLTFTRSGSMPSSRTTASDCDANASFSSTRSMSPTATPVRASSFAHGGNRPDAHHARVDAGRRRSRGRRRAGGCRAGGHAPRWRSRAPPHRR